MRKLLFIVILLIGLVSCEKRQTEIIWNQSFFQIGSQSSPRTADLNKDGVLDVVMGAGTGEMSATEDGVLAIDGVTGEILWKQQAPAHVVGSASFQDINDDGVPDVFIGGRGSFLTALDGQTGSVIWQYSYEYETDSILQFAKFNFYNSVWVPDQNEDGRMELLTVNGGNWNSAANSVDDRVPGVLMLFDSKSGTVMAADTMPDGQESYMSPLCFQDRDSGTWKIVFGTGGETLSGSLYVATLQDLLDQNLQAATRIATENKHGFIAPPVITDLNLDGSLDIAAISHASTIVAIDGKTMQTLWKQEFKGMESSNSLALGNFTSKERIELLAIMDEGTWPEYTNAHQVILDGANGTIQYRDSLGCFVISSAVVYDIDHNGYDEAFLNINDYHCDSLMIEEGILYPPGISYQLIAMDFLRKTHQVIDQTRGFRNIFSSPWIGDLDQDDYLDIIYSSYNHAGDMKRFLGMSLKRIRTPVKVRQPVKWGAYMGSEGNGIYR